MKRLKPLVDFSRLVRYSITSCRTCPFYSAKYCGLAQSINQQYQTDYPVFVANEWKSETSPANCPLKKNDMLFAMDKNAN
jgi:hypothetical protein